ncbi:jg11095 [Pararge aegeria aegeria]|uniref:Jg11095 protein n=1 Tax=Pararge aegeria aegeria TaxID=348720 RepID=A0A8S4SHJ5_9NEOP|nr:jg11095 [Pararge aegeria aegeria]
MDTTTPWGGAVVMPDSYRLKPHGVPTHRLASTWHAGILERAWMAGVASKNGKFHVQQAKRLRAETAQKKKKKKTALDDNYA